MIGRFDRLVIEAKAAETVTARRLTAWARRSGVEVVEHAAPPGSVPEIYEVEQSKRALRLTRHVGAALRPCTGRTDGLLCCNLQVVTQVVGCPLDCSYCILQHYQNRGEITVRVDPDDILAGVERELARQPRRLIRACTGQVADSLALEPEVGFAAAAVERFAGLGNGVLELKTKTDHVQELLSLDHGGRTIVSWSLNPPDVVEREEHGAASLTDRLRAAREVVERGYLVAFHLDPMVTVDGDPAPHLELVERIVEAVPPERVAYLSLGTVRFHPTMRRTIAGRFGRSQSTLAELLPDVDGKLRMLSPRRVALYAAVARRVEASLVGVPVYLCMEPPRVWHRALSTKWRTPQEVELGLAASLHSRFGLAPCEPSPNDYRGS